MIAPFLIGLVCCGFCVRARVVGVSVVIDLWFSWYIAARCHDIQEVYPHMSVHTDPVYMARFSPIVWHSENYTARYIWFIRSRFYFGLKNNRLGFELCIGRATGRRVKPATDGKETRGTRTTAQHRHHWTIGAAGQHQQQRGL